MITFERIVNKLGKNTGEIISGNEIGNIFDPDYLKNNKKYSNKIYKIIYRLKASKIIIPIKNGLFFISNGDNFTQEEIIDKFYWKIIKKIITSLSMGEYFLGGNKSLEIFQKNYSIPDKLIVYTKDIQRIINISKNQKIIFKIIKGGQKNPKLNNYTFISQFIKKVEIEGIKFNISCEELALLDSLNIHDNIQGIDDYQINKFLTKYKNNLSKDKLARLVSYKYISGINRLRIISKKSGYNNLYQDCLEIIKNQGGNCFLTL